MGFKLPGDQVDYVIEAGRDALRANPIFQDFIGQRRRPNIPRPRESTPVADAPDIPPVAPAAAAYTDARATSR